MILDHRTYVCRPGTIAKQLALYEAHGWDVQRRHLGEPLLYAQGETGDPNSYVHIWVYESAGDRETRRAAMQADEDWVAFLARSTEAGYLIEQRNQILKPASFFSLG